MKYAVPLVAFTLWMSTASIGALKKEDCEVCVSAMTQFIESLDSETKSHPKLIEDEFKNFCKDKKGKDNRFCYYIGGTVDSATGILGEMSKPVSWGLPVEKICEKLQKKDSQICELRYDKTYDFKTLDLKKLKVRDLKKILSNWEEQCEGCIEKTDYVKRIEELKPKYVKDEL